ncbi:MAG TPA: amidohydrolase family protein [Candidatus Binataceae bacterium]|nr:amidohydrolase family protein [Candidatus Binataceae bacterium]
MSGRLSSRQIRAKLGHPVIDADGHWLEFGPSISDYLKRVAGARAVDSFRSRNERVQHALAMTPEERRDTRRAQEAFWGVPAKNTRDRATAILPRLLYERLDEFGFDFTVLYPTAALGVAFIPDDEMRRATCRAFNLYVADQFREFSDRMTPAAAIPMYTPAEAIEELEYVVKTLGLKVILMGSMVRRTIPAVARKTPEAARYAAWFDVLGLDSEYNYDPVWAKCVELGVSPTFHTGTRGVGFRVSPTNFTFNHIGHFAAASEAVCKALFLGGVTRRFPTLNFAFLEGGVGWACNLYSDLIGHWKKRNREALEDVNPANLDRAMLRELIEKYGSKELSERVTTSSTILEGVGSAATGQISELDDFAACKIKRAEDIRELFTRNFYFGCEADDPINAWGFNTHTNPFGARLKTLFGSDIGHFDVVNMAEVLEEAFELVEDGLITENDFRDFVFANPVRFWGQTNPRFFEGTVVETAAAKLLRDTPAPAAPANA